MSETEVKGLIAEHRILEGSVNIAQSRIDLINTALNDLFAANETLEGLKDSKNGEEALIPIGGGSFLKANLTNIQNVIIGVGAGVCIEKNIDESIMDLKARLNELESARTSLQETLRKTMVELEKRQKRISEIMEGRRGESNIA